MVGRSVHIQIKAALSTHEELCLSVNSRISQYSSCLRTDGLKGVLGPSWMVAAIDLCLAGCLLSMIRLRFKDMRGVDTIGA